MDFVISGKCSNCIHDCYICNIARDGCIANAENLADFTSAVTIRC